MINLYYKTGVYIAYNNIYLHVNVHYLIIIIMELPYNPVA